MKNYPLAQSCDSTIAYALPTSTGQTSQSISLFDPNKIKANSFSTNQKTLTSISFSFDGKYLASAEVSLLSCSRNSMYFHFPFKY